MAKKGHIPIHKIPFNHDMGFEFFKITPEHIDTDYGNEHNSPLITHRDDFYMFFIQLNGVSEFMLDYEAIKLKGTYIGYMCPGQVHRYFKIESEGWMLAMDPRLMPEHLRVLFEQAKNKTQYVRLFDVHPHLKCIQLIELQQQTESERMVNKGVQYAVLEAFLGMVAQCILEVLNTTGKPLNRGQEITHKYRKLIHEKFIELKKPSEYAALLNISVSYLNEVVKHNTGFSASHIIQEEIFLEAKRLLYHTQLNAKAIAFKLGYEDPAYFSRLFRKHTGQTPLAFRTEQLHLKD